MRLVGFLLLAFLLAPGVLHADEAARTDGRVVTGDLTLEKTGKLLFTPTARGETVSLDDVTEILFKGAAPPPFRGAPGKVLHLPGGQYLTGVFLGLEKNNLLLRTAWADRLLVPRDGALALTHTPGWRPVVIDDFQGKRSGWKVQGEPETKAGAVLLSKPGQSLTCVLPTPLAEGRIGVTFREDAPLAGARWQVEAHFAVKGGDRVVRVTVAGADLAVEAGGLDGALQRVLPAKGWRRLRIDFSRGSFRILCDDQILWYALEQGAGGPLRQVRLTCAAPAKPVPLRGTVAFTDFVVEREVAEKRRPPGEPGQDELWLAGGDQLFGEVVRADGKGIELKGRFGLRRFPWTDLRGWFLKKRGARKPPAVAGRGPVVRLWLRSGLRPALDVLEGNLDAMDARQLKLRHPLLGELTIPRVYVARLRPLTASR